MNLVVIITHASFDKSRRVLFEALLKQLHDELPSTPVYAAVDAERRGSLWSWQRGLRSGLELYPDATHLMTLPDDVILAKGFGAAIRAAIEAQPEQVFDCFPNHAMAEGLTEGWYTTHNGFVGLGGVMPRALVEEHLAWRDELVGWAPADEPSYLACDTGVNDWAMVTGRLIWKTAVALMDHVTDVPSLDGNDHCDYRKPLNYTGDVTGLGGWDKPPVHLGKTYLRNHWESLYNRRAYADIEASYWVERNGASVSKTPHVLIAMPAYVTPELAVRASVQRTVEDLRAHDIQVTVLETPGDSLVTRGRHVLSHIFLCSTATHFLQWDADVEIMDHGAVRKMVETGHDIVGCAYPWRDGSGRVVCNPLMSTVERQHVDIDDKHCIKVSEIGTGFFMVSRSCLVDLMRRHPEEMYQADIEPVVGCPMWALFDARLEPCPGGGGRNRYASEDWRFCSLARAAGYDVNLYYPPILRHWGKKAHEGHVTKAWNFGVELESVLA